MILFSNDDENMEDLDVNDTLSVDQVLQERSEAEVEVEIEAQSEPEVLETEIKKDIDYINKEN